MTPLRILALRAVPARDVNSTKSAAFAVLAVTEAGDHGVPAHRVVHRVMPVRDSFRNTEMFCAAAVLVIIANRAKVKCSTVVYQLGSHHDGEGWQPISRTA